MVTPGAPSAPVRAVDPCGVIPSCVIVSLSSALIMVHNTLRRFQIDTLCIQSPPVSVIVTGPKRPDTVCPGKTKDVGLIASIYGPSVL
jgi:hypothetical protein